MSVKYLFSVVVMLAAGQAGAADGQYHIFTDQQDRVVAAKIIKVDALRGLVELELENKRRTKVKPSIFCEKDQAYIRDWQSVKSFNSSSTFKAEMKKKVVESWTEKGTAQRDFERVVYEIELTNRGGEPLDNLDVAYNVFYEQEHLKSSGQYTEKNCTKGLIHHARLEARASHSLKTDPLVVYDQHLSGGYDGYVGGLPERQEGDIKGIWVRVSLTTPSGLTAIREFLSPKSLINHQSWEAPHTPEPEKPSSGRKKGKKKRK
jgi:hypothetical protein